MAADFELDEITEIFLEESLEGLDTMETGLLGLKAGEADEEIMNDIFRAAHSIKGGAGTFGFMDVSEFTHGVETLLDEMRAGDRDVTPEAVQLLLRSVDRLRAMMDEIQSTGQVDTSLNSELEKEITLMLESSSGEVSDTSVNESQTAQVTSQSPGIELLEVNDVEGSANEDESKTRWAIEFTPNLQMLQKGNDPIRIFKELRKIGSLEVTSNIEDVPDVDTLIPENCYLRWNLILVGIVTEEQIYEIFDWVLEDCDLVIEEESEWVSSQDLKSSKGPKVEKEVKSSVFDNKVDEKVVEKVQPVAKQSLATAKSDKPAAVKPAKAPKETTSIRVSIEKVDSLLNLVGELVITQSMLKRFGTEVNSEDMNDLSEGLTQLERYTRELQENVMDIRMLPISFTFNRFPRLVHDISRKLGKKVDLEVIGEQTELDKTVLEKIGDPLVHLVRNSLDHGIEESAERIANGKPEVGKLTLSATQEGGNIVIRVNDDGAGINKDKLVKKAIEKGIIGPDDQLSDERIHNLIFHAGFSTVEQVSDLSGRGVGMDVVRRNIKDLGGRVEVQSEMGVGTSFTIRLPLTLAILDGQLVRVGDETYIMSLLSIVETVLLKENDINDIAGRADVYHMRGEYIPIIWLKDILQGSEQDPQVNREGLLVVVEADGRRVGLFVDELLDQQQVVIKNLDDNFRQVDGVSGATILGDGTVALILDIPGVLHGCLSNYDPVASKEQHAA
ncbi:MAG: chemotaxis protein CheA [Gammaproteobacteria bacterium]